MDELPADAPGVRLAGAIAVDAVADLVETTELLDFDLDELAAMVAFVAVDGFKTA